MSLFDPEAKQMSDRYVFIKPGLYRLTEPLPLDDPHWDVVVRAMSLPPR